MLYHWRIVATSVLAGDDVKPYAYEAGLRALAEHCERVGIDGEPVELDRRGHFRIRRRITDRPLVSIVIPTRGSSGRVWGVERAMVVEAVRGVIERSTWTDVEIVVVADVETPPEVIDELRDIAGHRLRLVWWEHPFDFSAKCNLGAAHATGDVLLFLNDDTEVITPGWLEAMLELGARPEVGAVGGKLLYPDGRIQHAGVVAGIFGNAGHAFRGLDGSARHYFDLPDVIRNVSAVTGACLLVRSEVFQSVGGFDDAGLPIDFNDIDLCLRLRQRGYRVLYTPHAVLRHHEGLSKQRRRVRAAPTAAMLMRSRWYEVIAADPFYSLNLTRRAEDYSIRS